MLNKLYLPFLWNKNEKNQNYNHNRSPRRRHRTPVSNHHDSVRSRDRHNDSFSDHNRNSMNSRVSDQSICFKKKKHAKKTIKFCHREINQQFNQSVSCSSFEKISKFKPIFLLNYIYKVSIQSQYLNSQLSKAKRNQFQAIKSNQSQYIQARPHESRCIGVFGLSERTTETDVRRIFLKYGPIESAVLVMDNKVSTVRFFLIRSYRTRAASINLLLFSKVLLWQNETFTFKGEM